VESDVLDRQRFPHLLISPSATFNGSTGRAV